MKWRSADRKYLRDLAWAWDPIGLPRNPETEEEYDCAIDLAVNLALTGLAPEALAGRMVEWGKEHFGIDVLSALSFARDVDEWCAARNQGV